MAAASPAPAPAREGLARGIAQQLKERIHAGEFKPGERLNEAALAVSMGTSRGPIREAIRILAGTGLVKPVANRGVYVREISLREMLEIYALRALVFGFAAGQAAENVDDAARQRFAALLEAMEQAAAAEDGGRYYALNLQFHALVLELAGNRRAHALYDSYVQELHLYRRQNFNRPGNMRRSNAEHRRIADAIARGNAAKARQAAQEHIDAGRQRMLASAEAS
jgi:DNA-binding GntR family transcriptional regulator